MNYKATLDWMFARLPMYQNIGAKAYKEDLTNTRLLANHLHNPQDKLKCIHVAGTNGKGSTSHMLAAVLQKAGYKVGLFTSPHLKDFKERIRINGCPISESFVCDFIQQNKAFLEKNQLSFFEMTVGLAFDYFVKQDIDIAIVEVGLGGRLDATNIITPLVSVITNIGLDHTQFLGNTLEAIAAEKAGIIKPNIPVVIGAYRPETLAVFLEKAKVNNAPIYLAQDLVHETPESDLKGNYQEENKKTVLQTLAILSKDYDFIIGQSQIENALLQVVKLTGLQGRWQHLGTKPTIICDTAHNNHGLEQVVKQLLAQYFERLHIVFGVVNDKDLDAILPILPKNAIYYFCKPDISRGLDVEILQIAAIKYNLFGSVYNSVTGACQAAIINAHENDFIYIGGSTFVVAEIL
jgi:dihydrofolate synthase / folylpolyglutamate synthase